MRFCYEMHAGSYQQSVAWCGSANVGIGCLGEPLALRRDEVACGVGLFDVQVVMLEENAVDC